MSFISIICPTYNEEKYISSCLDSIIKQDFEKDKIEVFIVDGMSNDRTREIVNNYKISYSFIKLLENPYKVVPHALNIGIKASKGDVIIRLDGHCEYPSNYISSLVRYLHKLKADNVGGVWNTLPAKNTVLCKAIAIGVSHPFGIGDSKHKVGAKEIIETDTVPFGCFRKDVFDRFGLFDEDLIRNQDDEFNGRIIKNGGKIYLIPELVIDYFARDKVSKMARMFYQYGLFKPLVNKKLGSPATVRQFFPLLFLVGLMVGFVLSFIAKLFLIIYTSVLAIYFVLSLYFSSIEAKKQKNFKLLFLLPYIFFAIHLSYGWGYMVGIYRFLILGKNKINVNINR